MFIRIKVGQDILLAEYPSLVLGKYTTGYLEKYPAEYRIHDSPDILPDTEYKNGRILSRYMPMILHKNQLLEDLNTFFFLENILHLKDSRFR